MPLLTSEAEEVHRPIVHTEQDGQTLCLVGLEIVGMQRLGRGVRTRSQVEEVAAAVPFEVGPDADELREVHEEDEVEVGH